MIDQAAAYRLLCARQQSGGACSLAALALLLSLILVSIPQIRMLRRPIWAKSVYKGLLEHLSLSIPAVLSGFKPRALECVFKDAALPLGTEVLEESANFGHSYSI